MLCYSSDSGSYQSVFFSMWVTQFRGLLPLSQLCLRFTLVSLLVSLCHVWIVLPLPRLCLVSQGKGTHSQSATTPFALFAIFTNLSSYKDLLAMNYNKYQKKSENFHRGLCRCSPGDNNCFSKENSER